MTTPYSSVVLAGGGSRCFWHVGFWREAAEPLGLRPRQLATVSAGAALGCAIVAGVGEEALRIFREETRKNPKNMYPGNLLGPDRMFPHERMYRGAMLALLTPSVLDRLHAGPDIRVLLGHAPRWLPARLGMLAGTLAYNFDKHFRRIVHPTTPLALGFRPEVVSIRECRTAERLADLILASSCTPPMTPLLTWNGHYVLDGGVVDNVPIGALAGDPGETLVLLTRRYPRLPDLEGRTYVMPSRPIPVSAWDYTSPDGLQQAYDLGRRDGEAFAKSHVRRLPASA